MKKQQLKNHINFNSNICIKLNYKMLIIKGLTLKFIAVIFTFFLTIKYAASTLIVCIFGKLPLRVCQSLKSASFGICCKFKFQKDEKGLNKNIKIEVQTVECLQSVMDSTISLCLTATLVNYNQIMVKFTLMVCHHVHHTFLSLIYEKIPDYSKQIEESYSNFLIWSFIVLGIFGISTQLAFVLDLINILTLPTKLLYRLLRQIYSYSTVYIVKLFQFITKDDRKWITCPYPKKYRNLNLRTVSLALLIVLVQFTVFVVFYYAWLSLVVLALKIIQNALENAHRVMLRLGSIICYLKKYEYKKHRQVSQSQIFPIIQPAILLKILKGEDLLILQGNGQIDDKKTVFSYNLTSVYKAFLRLTQNKFDKE